MSKPTLAFVDHELHKQTKSAVFLRELLSQDFEVHDHWDASWRGGPSVPVETLNSYDYVFFLQVMNPLGELARVTTPMVWAPMYDNFKPNYPHWRSLSHLNIKILSFSKKVSEWAERFSIPTKTVQYYYLSPAQTDAKPGTHLFFWYRGGITWEDIRSHLNAEQIDSFIIFERPDAKQEPLNIPAEDLSRYHITHLVKDFMPREEYLTLLKTCTVFIAPRKKEGIGAFTEALALGKCVIAWNDGVHNEYIENGIDGILFNKDSNEFDLLHAHEYGAAAYSRALKQHAKWEHDRVEIAPFITTPHTPRGTNINFWFWVMVSWTTARYRDLRYLCVVRLPRMIQARVSSLVVR